MTDSEWAMLEVYIRDTADTLGLRDWEFTLGREHPSDDGIGAMVIPVEGRKFAKIQVCADFRECASEKQRGYIVHELIHCHFAPATDMLRVELPNSGCILQSVYDILWGTFKRLMEYGVDGLESAISNNYPLIDWGDADG